MADQDLKIIYTDRDGRPGPDAAPLSVTPDTGLLRVEEPGVTDARTRPFKIADTAKEVLTANPRRRSYCIFNDTNKTIWLLEDASTHAQTNYFTRKIAAGDSYETREYNGRVSLLGEAGPSGLVMVSDRG